jgi:hypothetical protein
MSSGENIQANSDCAVPGFLHDYRIVRTYPNGVLEVCRRCKRAQYFKNDTPNHVYLSYHLRAILQPYQPRYKKEYAR